MTIDENVSSQDAAPPEHQQAELESFSYDDAIVRNFAAATLVWAFVGTTVGLIATALLVLPTASSGMDHRVNFAHIHPVYTNLAIFAFAGNAIFAAIYYATQRLCKARMWSRVLSLLHFWSWQAILIVSAVTLALGMTQGREYAELEWPIDIGIVSVWVVLFAANFLMTLVKRRERDMYVSLWFFIATVVAFPVFHVVNNLVEPTGRFESHAIYSGVHDAFLQSWYGHNLVMFFLTMPFLGLMYYFLPKATGRPIYSYKLAVLHFWALVCLSVFAGPRHMQFTPLPEWLTTLGLIFGVAMWMPAWGGLVNGLFTLRGIKDKVAQDPALKFFFVGMIFYGITTLEGSLLAIRGINAFANYTDWMMAHMQSVVFGWGGFMTFGMLYWLLPRVFQTRLASPTLATWHFRIGTLGIALSLVAMYAAGTTQGVATHALTDTGQLAYPDFLETLKTIKPMWAASIIGNGLSVVGIALFGINFLRTWWSAPKKYDVPVLQAGKLSKHFQEAPPEKSVLADAAVLPIAVKIDVIQQFGWHRRWERKPLFFAFVVMSVVLAASLVEFTPLFLFASNVSQIPTVKPYTPLELVGRDIYVAEGCNNCHSQVVRPLVAETKRYGEYSLGGEYVYDYPSLWGSRRIGPDIAREGGRQSSLWHLRHFGDPRSMSEGSVMPGFAHLVDEEFDYSRIPEQIEINKRVGVPYEFTDEEAIAHAERQGLEIAADIVKQGGPPMMHEQTIVALIAYVQRLGTDLFVTPPKEPATEGEDGGGEEPAAEEPIAQQLVPAAQSSRSGPIPADVRPKS